MRLSCIMCPHRDGVEVTRQEIPPLTATAVCLYEDVGCVHWSFTSKSDSRWNLSGQGYFPIMCGLPSEWHVHVEKCRELYGEPPEDIKYDCCKE